MIALCRALHQPQLGAEPLWRGNNSGCLGGMFCFVFVFVVVVVVKCLKNAQNGMRHIEILKYAKVEN